jgi:hypothetical protein
MRLRVLGLDSHVDLRHPCTAVHTLEQYNFNRYTGPADGGFNATELPPVVTGEG